MSEKMWEPSEKRIESSLLNFFMIESPLDSDSYFDLHRWSIDNMEAFWSSFLNFSGIIYSKKYETVLTNPTMPGASWFSGSELNYAENLLSGNPEQVAIISVGEGRDDLQ
jgi:acetoacetyl-CoA synthetase